MQFINRAALMANSLSNLVDNLAEEIHKIECNYWHDNKKCEVCSECSLGYTKVENYLILYKCLYYNMN